VRRPNESEGQIIWTKKIKLFELSLRPFPELQDRDWLEAIALLDPLPSTYSISDELALSGREKLKMLG
jgi:hypothetical protein